MLDSWPSLNDPENIYVFAFGFKLMPSFLKIDVR
jgi:hypothetical protein